MEQHTHPAILANGRYAIHRRLGSGGEGSVFLAHDSVLGRWVAIKRIHDRHTRLLPETGATREATNLASLQHPNIITIHDIAALEDELLVVMEYLPGQNVDELSEPMDAAFFLEFATQCLRGLAAAHAIGMVHRDIKPSNIMVAGQHSGGFQVKILDFGLAKIIDEPTLQTMDHSGSLMGSIFMMSPEQLEGRPIDHRTDIYSLGCVFYKALSREYPFRGKSVPAVIAAHLSHAHEPLGSLRPDLPPPLVAWVERLFARDSADRPVSATEALQSLPAIGATPQSSFKKSALPPTPMLPTAPPQPSGGSKSSTPKFLIIASSVLLLTGTAIWFLDGFSEKNPHSKMIAEADAPSEARTSFGWRERKEILRREGQKTTITGTIGGFEEDKEGRFHLTFKDASPRDPTLCFDRAKGDFSMLLLKKNVGLDIQATGIVGTNGNRVYLENPTLREFVISKSSPTPRD